jgi:O-succinylbenzoic acid--CoA ligase
MRSEAHFGDRVVRCFVDRPRDTFDIFESAVDLQPDKEAIVCGAHRLTYRGLKEWVERVAAGLSSRGIAPGDRVAILAGNCAEFVVSVLATLRLGGIAVPIGSRLAAGDIRFILEHSGARAIVFQRGLESVIAAIGDLPALDQRIRCAISAGEIAFEGVPLDAPRLSQRRPASEEQTAVLLYTSGTTGRPKGAMLSHLNISHSVTHFELAHGLRCEDRSVLAVPGSHVTGLIAIIFSMFKVGGTVLILPAFNAREFMAFAESERMTHTVLVPAMYSLCLREPDFRRYELSAWRIGSYGGSPMPESAIIALGEALPGLILINGYGATEATSPASMTPPGEGLARRETIGLPLHCADIIVVDERGREVPIGEVGEIWIRGPMVVRGYWNDPEATQASFTGGYWHSGDLGKFDVDGYLRLVDRLKDMINRGGYKVYSVEVENVLAQHEAVSETAVVGRPCPILGERVHAFVTRRGAHVSEQDLASFCASRLADYKVPESFTILDHPLPRNGSGKVLKRSLREALLAGAEGVFASLRG